MTETTASFAEMANAIRALSMDAVQKANSGHPGMPMGMADVATVLFTQFLKYDPKAPEWADRDRYVLSAGHGSMLLYALLHLTGYDDMTMAEIENFRQLGAKTAGHPEFGHASGIETTTGPLGQGIANAVGMAIAEAQLVAKFGHELVDHHTYVIAGDGCLMEGISQEAISLAGHLGLGKLIVLFDDNDITIDGPTSIAVSDDQLMRFEASGWATMAIDGHDQAQIAKALEIAKVQAKPTLIACKTTIGKGAPTKAGTAGAHGSPLGPEEIVGAKAALGWTAEPFTVPAPILDAWRDAGARSAQVRQAWEARLAASDVRAEFDGWMSGQLPAQTASAMADYRAGLLRDQPGWASRKSSQEALKVLTAEIPNLVGGSADLTGSNNTNTPSTAKMTPEDFSGRHIHWGVREHAMVAAMNGMALHKGVIPYGGTFLVFSDYCRPALRLAALMNQRVVFVGTHDSIGLGEDGPTHQPVEHLAALRAIPNMLVMRPADAIETAECWEAALANATGPTVMALTRQGLKALRTEATRENWSAKGAYVLKEAQGVRQATIIATGSEVGIAIDAQARLAANGIDVAVVSMPCMELFERQDDNYKADVLGIDPCVAVEAGIAFGWTRYVANEQDVIGMPGFGASGPADELYAHFGITAANVVKRVTELVSA